MSARTGVSVEEYLHTSFPDLDREYRDGELVERSLPDYLHGKTQGLLFAFFLALRAKFPLFPCVETRMKIRANVYLIPDVAVFWPEEPPNVPQSPPLIAIEVRSEDDRSLPAQALHMRRGVGRGPHASRPGAGSRTAARADLRIGRFSKTAPFGQGSKLVDGMRSVRLTITSDFPGWNPPSPCR
jgi:Putative restriction endonuclease